jgi:hypothetical protein
MQPATREGRAGLGGKSERPILPKKPGNAGGGKGPWFKSNARRSKGKEIGVSLITPESVWQLQEALHAKAKREPAGRFHALYDKLYRKDVLLHAWRCCRTNGGAPGVDGVTFQQIEQGGVNGWLEEPLVCESMNTLERKPDARDGHVRFDERGVETERMAGYSGAGNRKGRSPLRPAFTPPRHSSTLQIRFSVAADVRRL